MLTSIWFILVGLLFLGLEFPHLAVIVGVLAIIIGVLGLAGR